MKPGEWSRDAAVRCAVRLLSYKDRSERELAERLAAKGIPPELAGEAIAFLKEKGFVDDRRLAERIVSSARQTGRFGRRGVREYLLKRGVPASLAEESAGTDEEYLHAARTLIEKRLSAHAAQPDSAALRRIWGLLARRGFSQDIIRTTIREATGSHL